jgi:hypothetical protein
MAGQYAFAPAEGSAEVSGGRATHRRFRDKKQGQGRG